jgi:hypothetical protein
MAFLHLGQIGGGEFLGMALTLDQARVLHSLSPMVAEDRAMILNFMAAIFRLSVRSRTQFALTLSDAGPGGVPFDEFNRCPL